MPRKYLLTLLVIATVLFAVVLITVGFFNRGSSKNTSNAPKTAQQIKTEKASKLDSARKVSFTSHGRLVSDQERRGIRIEVTAQEVRLDILRTYSDEVESTKSFENTKDSFDNLLANLRAIGYDATIDSRITDKRAACPTNWTYDYGIEYSDGSKNNTWSTTCPKVDGTFGGDEQMAIKIMQAQVPNYYELTRSVQF